MMFGMDQDEKLSPVEQALADLNGNLSRARTHSEDSVTLPKETAVWLRDIIELSLIHI